jgi:hypothetical protein
MQIQSDMRRSTAGDGLPRAIRLLVVIGLLAGVPACTRCFYRNCADREVNDILAEKEKYPAWWKIQAWHVYPDWRARFADPTNPDRPPMPPDDPAADALSPRAQRPGHAGVASVEGTGYLEIAKVWDEENRARRKADQQAGKDDGAGEAQGEPAEGAVRADAAPADRTGPVQKFMDQPLNETQGFLITLDQAMEMAVINSREYQTFREQLYEQALPVTLQRFSFAFQWQATEQAFRQWAGIGSLQGHQNNWTLGYPPLDSSTGPSQVSFTKLFSTGALLTAAFANNTVWNFLAPAGQRLTSQSTIDLSFLQPFLQGGGKAVTLEPLTEAERNLLYSIRAYARFRELAYVEVALGTVVPASLQSVAGTTNLSNPISALAALGIASTDVSGGFVGFYSTLFREVDMAVDKKLVYDVETALRIYEGYQEGGLFSPLQVEQVRATLLSAKNNVLNDLQLFNNALDQTKELLGLPTNMPLILDDSAAQPITSQFDRYYAVISDSSAAYKLVEKQDSLSPEQMRAFLLTLYTTDPLVRGTEFRKRLPPAWDAWKKLNGKELAGRLEGLGKQRTDLLDLKTDLDLKGKTLADDQTRLLKETEFEIDLGNLEQLLRGYDKRPWEKRPKEQQTPDRLKQFRQVAYQAQIVLVAARNERFTAVGKLWPTVPTTPLPEGGPQAGLDLLTLGADQAQELAVQTAMNNRIDLMNGRAQVVDAWRQLRVTANALLGVFNVQYQMDATTPRTGSNPLAFATNRTNSELVLNAQLPLNRLAQRNAYRTALINYQLARRNLMGLEDNVAAQVRFDVRQLLLFEENYRIQQKVIQSWYSQVESALEVIVAPADPDNLKSTGTAGQANAAALTTQYLGALNSLNGSQTAMYRYWLSILATRIQVYADLERLNLDSRGVWYDEPGKSLPGQSGTDGQRGPGEPCFPAGPPSTPDGGIRPAPAEELPRPRFLTPAPATPLE